ncbi:unnamed protein product [Brassica rapa subsp. trilocularis]
MYWVNFCLFVIVKLSSYSISWLLLLIAPEIQCL